MVKNDTNLSLITRRLRFHECKVCGISTQQAISNKRGLEHEKIKVDYHKLMLSCATLWRMSVWEVSMRTCVSMRSEEFNKTRPIKDTTALSAWLTSYLQQLKHHTWCIQPQAFSLCCCMGLLLAILTLFSLLLSPPFCSLCHSASSVLPGLAGNIDPPSLTLCYKQWSLKVQLAWNSDGGMNCYEGLPQ